MMAGIPPTLGSQSGRWPCRDARSTWPSRGMHDGLADQVRGLVRRGTGGRGGDHVHHRAHHRHRGRRPVGEQLRDAGQVGVLQRQAGQLAVHRHQLTEHQVLSAEVTLAARTDDVPGGSRKPVCHDSPGYGRSVVLALWPGHKVSSDR